MLSFEDEAQMLRAWAAFVRRVDPDLFVGYNIKGFDLPYLVDRAAVLGAFGFPFLGRLLCEVVFMLWSVYSLIYSIDVKTEVSTSRFSSKAYGTRESKNTRLSGRLQFDLLQLMFREHKLRSYSLNSVCSRFLGEQKEDVHHTDITALHNGTADTRRRLAVYCLKVRESVS